MRRLSLLRLLLCLAICAAISGALRTASPSCGVDYYQFWGVGRAVVHEHVRDAYTVVGGRRLAEALGTDVRQRSDPRFRQAASQRRTLVPTSTPLLYAVLGSWSTNSYSASLKWHRLGLTLAFSLATLTFARLCGLDVNSSLAALALLSAEFPAYASDLRVGNVNALQLAGLAGYAWLRVRRPWPRSDAFAGAWLGVLLAFKPNLLFALVLLLLQPVLADNWRRALYDGFSCVIGAAVAAVVAAWSWGGLSAWVEWYEAGVRELSGVALVRQGNCAVFALLPGLPAGFVMALLLVAVAGAVTLGWRLGVNPSRSRTGRSGDVRSIWYLAFGCLLGLLFTHLAWLHYFVFTLPALLLVSSRWRSARFDGDSLARGGLVASAWLLSLAGHLLVPVVEIRPITVAWLSIAAVFVLLCSLSAQPEAPWFSSREGESSRRLAVELRDDARRSSIP